MRFVVSALAAMTVGGLLSSSTPAAGQTPIDLVTHTNVWRWHKGNTPLQSNWKTATDAGLDGTWLSSRGGFGYSTDNANETNACRTVLGDMRNSYSTLYMRQQFTVTDPLDPAFHLLLTMDFDDGFIVWLDGNYLTSVNSPGAPAEPATNAMATASHETSRGNVNNSPQPAVTYDLGLLAERLPVGTHTLALIGLNQTLNSSDLIQIVDLSAGIPVCPPTSICEDTLWTSANSPYVIPATLTIAPGATLTIESGVSVLLGSGANLLVDGRLVAEGTPQAPILFSRASGATAWGGVTVNGGVGSPETRIAHAHFEFNGSTAIHADGGTVFLDHLTFGTTSEQYVSLDGASFVISDCVFPSATAGFELVHGTGGIKSGGRGLFLRNYFGIPIGYNDVVDFTGGNRPAQPIVQFINNVFNGATDDILDLDGTDAWVEGNIFLHVHKNGSPDSASAVSGGRDGTRTSEVTIIGNLFYDCDQAATGKEGNFYVLLNNTIVRQTHEGGTDTEAGVVNLGDEGTAEGAGMYLEGNIIVEAEQLTRNVVEAVVTFTNNLVPIPWTGLGGNNSTADPMLQHIPALSETDFTNWTSAQILREWFSLRPGSPALGTGPNGLDMGGVIPLGASISGEPSDPTPQTSATLLVGPNRTGHAIPAASWTAGAGYTHYKWRLDEGAWSAETPIDNPIQLMGLSDGPHHVDVTGRRDTGFYQDDSAYGSDAVVTRSRVWTVQTTAPLEIDSLERNGNVAVLRFTAAAGKTYSVQATSTLGGNTWTKVEDVAVVTSQQVTVMDTNASASRFYRLVSPSQP